MPVAVDAETVAYLVRAQGAVPVVQRVQTAPSVAVADRAREAAIDYIARDKPAAALSQLDAIQRQVKILTDHPEIGRPGRVDGTRELVISRTPFILVCRIDDAAVRILHFLHGARQWPPTPE